MAPSCSKLLAKPLALLLATTSLAWASPTSDSDLLHRAPKLGAVASESSVCSEIGIQLLKEGGNAVDAFVGTQFCVGVIGMYHSGIGGGGFLLLRTSNGTYEFVDFRETAPAAAFEDMYKDNEEASINGGLASGVPGELRGSEYIHNKYGRLPWRRVVEPAVRVARDGFTVTQDLINQIGNTSPNTFLTEDPSWAVDFAPRGRLVRLGETMTRKRYAKTLQAIADHGADAFYAGPIAEATIRALQAANGTMTLDDLRNYTVAIRSPAQIEYRGYKVTSTSSPSSGDVVLSALNTVNGYHDFYTSAQWTDLSTHRLDEAIRFAYGQRTEMGDPSFVDGMDEYTQKMHCADTGAEIRSKISDFRTQDVSYYDPDGLESLETPGTSHIVAADASGMAVSGTTTINLLFGSKLNVPETGVIMNDEMNDFSIPGANNSFGFIPSPANFIRPGKRPLSSISPLIVESDGKLYLAIGSAGGSRIITANIQNFVNVIDKGKTVAEALAMPRLHDQLVPNVVAFEYAYDNETTAYMKALGHNVSWVAPGQSTAQGVRLLRNGTFEAAGEPRQKASGGFAV